MNKVLINSVCCHQYIIYIFIGVIKLFFAYIFIQTKTGFDED